MRKRIINQDSSSVSPTDQKWLDLEPLAQVEVTSEDAAYPIESALMHGRESRWRAAQPGEQVIRLLFDKPLSLRHIHLRFEETEQERMQEFALLWSPGEGQSYREIVRQQYNFSPPGTSLEVEDYNVNLNGVTALELRIVPDKNGGQARASLAQLRLA
jgi:hypothetical protein